jgi:GNAT superfamily N-acetyltransferase
METPTHFHLTISPATSDDVPVILRFIRGLAEYEKLSHRVVADEQKLRETLFGERPYAEVLIARLGGDPAGFALFFHSYSTFLAKPGIYLEDVFVKPAARGKGVGKALLRAVARAARDRGCGRLEWSVLDWNTPAIEFYQSLGAVPHEGWTTYRMDEAAISALAQ